jgi:sec-independent protein translocase protein TatB
MFYLFIFESIGTQELILIGIIAMIFLGPRKLPEYAKKIGKMMSEFRGTAQEFRSTWEREVNFEEEAEAIRSGELPETKPVPRIKQTDEPASEKPEQMIKTIDKDRFDELREQKDTDLDAPDSANLSKPEKLSADKRNWF